MSLTPPIFRLCVILGPSRAGCTPGLGTRGRCTSNGCTSFSHTTAPPRLTRRIPTPHHAPQRCDGCFGLFCVRFRILSFSLINLHFIIYLHLHLPFPTSYPKLGPSTELFVVPATFGSAMGCSDPSDQCEDPVGWLVGGWVGGLVVSWLVARLVGWLKKLTPSCSDSAFLNGAPIMKDESYKQEGWVLTRGQGKEVCAFSAIVSLPLCVPPFEM